MNAREIRSVTRLYSKARRTAETSRFNGEQKDSALRNAGGQINVPIGDIKRTNRSPSRRSTLSGRAIQALQSRSQTQIQAARTFASLPRSLVARVNLFQLLVNPTATVVATQYLTVHQPPRSRSTWDCDPPLMPNARPRWHCLMREALFDRHGHVTLGCQEMHE
jgi:hypothetical protein